MTARQALLVDIGSTYTKVVVVDLDRAEVVAQGKSVTTVEEDVTLGLERALEVAGVGLDSLPVSGCRWPAPVRPVGCRW